MNDFAERRAKYMAFTETPIGKAFVKFDHAVINYWRHDADDSISDKRMLKLSEEEGAARKEFLDLLMEIQK
jgi:hypothetical protein